MKPKQSLISEVKCAIENASKWTDSLCNLLLGVWRSIQGAILKILCEYIFRLVYI